MAKNIKSNNQFGLEIKKRPSIISASIFGFLVLFLFLTGLSLWAYFAPIESAAVVPGKVIVAGQRRTIEHLEGGIVKAIYAHDGEKVMKGQVLVGLDETRPFISLQILKNEALELLAIEARLKAERDNNKEVNFPKRLNAIASSPKGQEIIQSQRAIFKSNQESFLGNISILNQRITQLKQQIEGLQTQLKANNDQLALIKKEVKSVKYLADRNLIEESRLLALQREQAKLEGMSGDNLSNIALTQQKIGEALLQISTIKSKHQMDILTQLRETQQKLAETLEKEKAAADTLARTQIRSPQNGYVMDSKIHTLGGVISPGETLMDIVPTQESLVIDARISPLDIDVVHTGLEARVRLSSYKQRSTPTLMGKVILVSADAFEDERSKQTYYKAKISIPKEELQKLKGKTIQPGMPAEVMIITNKLSPFEYFITPIRDSFNRAFRED